MGGSRAQASTLPKGLSFDSKPGPGELPQTFELDADTAVLPQGTVAACPPTYLLQPSPTTFLVVGASVPFTVSDTLLMRSRSGAFSPFLLQVKSLKTEPGEDGKTRTRVVFTSASPLPTNEPAADVEILYPAQAMPVWNEVWAVNLNTYVVHLAGVARDLHPDDLIAMMAPGVTTELMKLTAIGDVVWYSNHPAADDPSTPPTDNPKVAALCRVALPAELRQLQQR